MRIDSIPPPQSGSIASVLAGIKLVIWDLDDTVWTGTLSEGAIAVVPGRLALLRAMAHAGIINSVCSNNEPDAAELALRNLGVWDLLVFPQLAWTPKAPMIDQIIASAQLRAEQVLFIDDNPRVRAEAAQMCDVRVMDPAELDLCDPADLPATDSGLQRIRQYRLLEAKALARATRRQDSAAEFLRHCAIRIGFGDPALSSSRVVELASRANQLNITKQPVTESDLLAFRDDPRLDTAAIWLTDRFGDYGIVGLYVLDKQAHALRQFVFSCRVLNMGVEQFVFQRLGRPSLPPAAAAMRQRLESPVVDWVDVGAPVDTVASEQAGTPDVLFVGGCDVEALWPYAVLNTGLRTASELPDVAAGAHRYGHSSVLVYDVIRAGFGSCLDEVPWLSNWSDRLLTGGYRAAVLSLWADYVTVTYRHRELGFRIPSFVHFAGESTEEERSYWCGDWPGYERFLDTYEEAPGLSPEEFTAALERLRRAMPRTPLVLLNSAEIGADAPQTRRAAQLNAAVDVFAVRVGVDVVDLRVHVGSSDRLSNDQVATHYARRVYAELGTAVRERLAAFGLIQ